MTFSGHCFYKNPNIRWSFQICISVSLKKTCLFEFDGKFLTIPSCAVLSQLTSKYYWTLDVTPTAPYEITLFRLSVCLFVRCPSVCPWLNFSWPWYIETEETRRFQINSWPKQSPISLNQALNEIFRHFLDLGS